MVLILDLFLCLHFVAHAVSLAADAHIHLDADGAGGDYWSLSSS